MSDFLHTMSCEHTVTVEISSKIHQIATSSAAESSHVTVSTPHRGLIVITLHLFILTKSKARLQKHVLQPIQCQCKIKPIFLLPLESEYYSAIFLAEHSVC